MLFKGPLIEIAGHVYCVIVRSLGIECSLCATAFGITC